MFSTMWHPRLEALNDFVAGGARDRVAAHLERCGRCRETVQLLRAMSRAAREMAGPSLPPGLREQVLADRAEGVRTILPSGEVATRRPDRRLAVPLSAAGLLLLLAAALLLTRTTHRVEAGTIAGALTLTPAMPLPGQSVEVRYAADARLSGEPWLVLRARLRSPAARDYNGGLPIVSLAVLRPTAAGEFRGTFALPDTVVFAALVVEDSAGAVIDDAAGREWELLVAGPDSRPVFDALRERARDMMGRNWEEGYATARRIVVLYPDTVESWTLLRAFQIWLGRGDDDSVIAVHRAKLAAFDAQLAGASRPSVEQMGYVAWYAVGLDSAVLKRWRARLLRDAPSNSFAVQWRLMDVLHALRANRDTAGAMRDLETLWEQAPADRRTQVASYGGALALAAGDLALIRRWTEREIGAAEDPRDAARWVAYQLVEWPALRREGMQRLRAELAALATLPASERGLRETVAGQRERYRATRREVLARLGRAMVSAGEPVAGLDTLALAAAAGWDVAVFRAAYAASLQAGDTAGALTMGARIISDPGTDSVFADSVRSLALRRLDAEAWQGRLSGAREEFTARVLASTVVRPLPGDVRLRDLRGSARDLRDLTGGVETVVFFWSRFCGPAIEALPQMGAVARRLAGSGVRTISIVDETSPSAELSTFLRDKHVAMPVYLDPWHEASQAFNQWGTPSYYVLDSQGRINFNVTTSLDELLVRAEALRLRGEVHGASP